MTLTFMVHSLPGAVSSAKIQLSINQMEAKFGAFRDAGVTIHTSLLKDVHPELARCFDLEFTRLQDVAGEVTAEAATVAAWIVRDPAQLGCARDQVAWWLPPEPAEVLNTALARMAALVEGRPLVMPGLVLGVKKTRLGTWGETADVYPRSASIVSFDIRELTQHEVLHQLHVSDGYDETSHEVLPGCERCIMQFEPNRGSGLCSRHDGELRRALERWSGT